MKKFVLIISVVLCALSTVAQEIIPNENTVGMAKYRRSSLYSVLMKHSSFPYAAQIDSAFMAMPMPDKFNDHNLEMRSFESTAVKMKQKGQKKTEGNLQDSDNFINENGIAKKLVEKWFDRDEQYGGFDMNLIQERGFYDASQLDIANAEQSVRHLSVLGDAGEDLIAKTFVIINDITFVDKGENSKKVAGGLAFAGKLMSQITGDNSYTDVGNVAAGVTNEIDGFKVNITSYLYKLVWNEEVAATFYQDCWFQNGTQDDVKKANFDNSDMFKVEYVGQTTSSAANLATKSFSKKSKGEQMLKVCARAVDKSIVELQREYDEFKVNVPIYKISEDARTVEVQIGLKEGINEKSQFEVLLPVEGEDGKLKYDKIGMIQPVKEKIWDNRFGALEEAQDLKEDGGDNMENEDAANLEAASLTSTTFKVLSGGNKIVPGCLVREVTIKRDK